SVTIEGLSRISFLLGTLVPGLQRRSADSYAIAFRIRRTRTEANCTDAVIWICSRWRRCKPSSGTQLRWADLGSLLLGIAGCTCSHKQNQLRCLWREYDADIGIN